MSRLQAKKLVTRNLEISRNFVKSANGGSTSNVWVNSILEFLLSAVTFVCPVAFTQVLISAFSPLFCTVSAIRANTKDLTEEQSSAVSIMAFPLFSIVQSQSFFESFSFLFLIQVECAHFCP